MVGVWLQLVKSKVLPWRKCSGCSSDMVQKVLRLSGANAVVACSLAKVASSTVPRVLWETSCESGDLDLDLNHHDLHCWHSL
jgi:hypothetical protein